MARLAKLFRDECDIYSPLLVFSFYSFFRGIQEKKTFICVFLICTGTNSTALKEWPSGKKKIKSPNKTGKKSLRNTFCLIPKV